tara:strand:- start:3216 stop:4502 length:1287 start_codon:yes stop_codon:yes gene_type:complete
MNPLALIVKEISHRKANALLSLLAITIAVALVVIFFSVSQGTQREQAKILGDMNASTDGISQSTQKKTKRIQRDMGQNLRIVSEETDLAHFWDEGFSKVTFPEDWLQQFTNVTKQINYSHLSAILKWKIDWRGSPAMVYGLAPREVAPPGREKPIMITPVKRGTIQLGKTLSEIHKVNRDDVVKVENGEFQVDRVLAEKGSGAEIRIYMHLADAQSVLNREGLINEIQALDCYCADESQDTLTLLREQLAPILPKAKVFRMQDMAEAREQQRRLMEAQLGEAMPKVINDAIESQTSNLEKTFTKMLPVMVFLCGLSIAALAMLNTRDRRQEIGIFRALGHGGLHIAILFLGKAVAIGIAGAIIGYVIGGYITLNFGQELFALTKAQLKWEPSLLIEALWLAPAFAALATFIPAMLAVVQDPADTLRHD